MFTPYEHQTRIVKKTIESLDSGKKPLIILGTGGGKTAIAAMLAKKEPGYVLICCCMVPLIMQFNDDLEMVLNQQTSEESIVEEYVDELLNSGYPPEEIGILQGDNSDSQEYLSRCRVVVAMSQTLQSPRGAEFLANNTFDLFIGDERHRAELDIAEILVDAPKNVGMTATPWRGDGDESLMNDFDWIQEITMQEMIDQGFLIDYDHFFYPEDVEEQVYLEPEYVFDEWARILYGIPTLGFCKTIEEAQQYSDYFTSQGYPCALACDDTPDDEFEEARRQFRAGEIHVIWSVTKIATGFNEPIAKGLLACCKRKSLSLWIQMIGRIVRKDGTGRTGTLLDFFNNGRRLADPRDITDWYIIPQASGKTCQECGLKNSTKRIYCKGCGHCLINDREKDEIKNQIMKDVDLTEYVRLHKPMVRDDRRAATLDRVGVAKTAREIAFWERNCDPSWAASVQKEHFPDESPIVSSQVLEGAIFPSGMSPEDLGAYLAYLNQYAEHRQHPNAWIVSQVRAEGGQAAIDMLNIAYAA